MSIDRIILGTARLAVRMFYRVSVEGASVPDDGPLVLVGNHPNGLVDPVLLTCATERSLRFLGKEPLFRMPVLGWLVRGARVLPVHRPQDGANTQEDNVSTFSAVFDALAAGDAIALFPEGKSHSEPKLQRLKTGAARMALGAEERAGFQLGTRVVPIGLVYRARRRLGSRAVVWVGPAIPVDDLAALHAEDPWKAVTALTGRVQEGLAALTLELERWEELPLLEFVADLRAAPQAGSFEDVRRLAHELAIARVAHPDEVLELAERARSLKEGLEAFGARPRDLALAFEPGAVLRYVLRQGLRAVVLVPLAFLGRLVWFAPYQATSLLVRSSHPSEDTWATTAVLAAMVLFPAWLLALGVLVGLGLGTGVGVGVAAGAILVGLVALAAPPWRRALLGDVRAFLRARGRSFRGEHLLAERDDLVRRIEAIRLRVAAQA